MQVKDPADGVLHVTSSLNVDTVDADVRGPIESALHKLETLVVAGNDPVDGVHQATMDHQHVEKAVADAMTRTSSEEPVEADVEDSAQKERMRQAPGTPAARGRPGQAC